MNAAQRLLIVIPCLNEEAHLPVLLDRLCADQATEGARIVVADGGSTDRSIEIVRARAQIDARVTLLPNPARRQGAGVNLANTQYADESEFFIRIDAHAAYPENFLSRLIAAQRETGADSVTVSMRALADAGACFQRAAACAQNSALGTGGSAHRKGGARGWVDHGHHALFRVAAFRAVDGYDESFTHNEDAELDARIVANGGKILLAADIVIDYFPRANPVALARQYYNYGRGRARTILKHRALLKLRQLVPIPVAPCVLVALLWPLSGWFALPFLAWLGLCLGYGALLGSRERDPCAAFSGVAAAVMHSAWSAGFCIEVLSRLRPAAASRQPAAS